MTEQNNNAKSCDGTALGIKHINPYDNVPDGEDQSASKVTNKTLCDVKLKCNLGLTNRVASTN